MKKLKIAILGSLSCYPEIKEIKEKIQNIAEVTAPPLYKKNLDLKALERGEKRFLKKRSNKENFEVFKEVEKKWIKEIQKADFIYLVPKKHKNNIGMNTMFELLYALTIGKRVYSKRRINCEFIDDFIKDKIKVIEPEKFKKILQGYSSGRRGRPQEPVA